MISNTDFEKLWFLYQTDGAQKGVSITSFCKQQGVPYNEFEKWYKKTHRTVARVEVTGALNLTMKQVGAKSRQLQPIRAASM